MKYITIAPRDGSESQRERDHRRLAYEAALEGIVLLENHGALPLETNKVALYGSGATGTIKGGTGSGEVHERHSVNILEGLEQAGFEVTTIRRPSARETRRHTAGWCRRRYGA